jgi:hypothetical protein
MHVRSDLTLRIGRKQLAIKVAGTLLALRQRVIAKAKLIKLHGSVVQASCNTAEVSAVGHTGKFLINHIFPVFQ